MSDFGSGARPCAPLRSLSPVLFGFAYLWRAGTRAATSDALRD